MKDTFTIEHQRVVWREAYNAALIGAISWGFGSPSEVALEQANRALKKYIERWPSQ